jgi:integrase
MVVVTSYDDGTTKTEVERWMPVHPALAGILAEWKLTGWPAAFGRAPAPDDLVVPVTAETRKGRQKPTGAIRDRHYAWKRLAANLRELGLRHRRAHDLRRTGITLARAGGADRDRLRRGTHGEDRDVLELYTSVEWALLCGEVMKLQAERLTGAKVVRLVGAVGGKDA